MLKVERNFSEYTLKSYHDDLVQFNEFLNSEHLELTTFEYKDARNYLSYLYSNNLKRTTVSRKISTLRTFYEYWMTQDESVVNPLFNLYTLRKNSIFLNSFTKRKWKHYFEL